jgi:hypothetical protein
MALNPNYESIGKAFTEQYYNMFDNQVTRYTRFIPSVFVPLSVQLIIKTMYNPMERTKTIQ